MISRRCIFLGLAAVVFGAGIWAQIGEVRPRELFYEPPPGTAPAPTPAPPSPRPRPKPAIRKEPAPSPAPTPVQLVSSRPLVLRYSVLRRENDQNFAEVGPDTEFQTGDAVKLRVEVNDTSYLYVIAQGSSGAWDVMFPRPDQGETDNRVGSGQVYDMPARPWILDKPSGVERLFLLLVRQPDESFDRVIRQVYPASGVSASPDGGIPTEQVERLKTLAQARDLVFEKGDETDKTGRKDHAVYIMTKVTGRPGAITASVSLKH